MTYVVRQHNFHLYHCTVAIPSISLVALCHREAKLQLSEGHSFMTILDSCIIFASLLESDLTCWEFNLIAKLAQNMSVKSISGYP